MADAPKKVLRLTFVTTGGKTFNLTLPYPRQDLTPAEIEGVITMIIEKNIFTTSSGDLCQKKGYKFIDKTTTQNDPPDA